MLIWWACDYLVLPTSAASWALAAPSPAPVRPPLTIRAAGAPTAVGVQSLASSSEEGSAGMRLSRSSDSQCYTDQNGGAVCPTLGAPLKKMPPLLHPDAPQDLAVRGQQPHPACYSGSQSEPCDESFRLKSGAAVAEDSD